LLYLNSSTQAATRKHGGAIMMMVRVSEVFERENFAPLSFKVYRYTARPTVAVLTLGRFEKFRNFNLGAVKFQWHLSFLAA